MSSENSEWRKPASPEYLICQSSRVCEKKKRKEMWHGMTKWKGKAMAGVKSEAAWTLISNTLDLISERRWGGSEQNLFSGSNSIFCSRRKFHSTTAQSIFHMMRMMEGDPNQQLQVASCGSSFRGEVVYCWTIGSKGAGRRISSECSLHTSTWTWCREGIEIKCKTGATCVGRSIGRSGSGLKKNSKGLEGEGNMWGKKSQITSETAKGIIINI